MDPSLMIIAAGLSAVAGLLNWLKVDFYKKRKRLQQYHEQVIAFLVLGAAFFTTLGTAGWLAGAWVWFQSGAGLFVLFIGDLCSLILIVCVLGLGHRHHPKGSALIAAAAGIFCAVTVGGQSMIGANLGKTFGRTWPHATSAMNGRPVMTSHGSVTVNSVHGSGWEIWLVLAIIGCLVLWAVKTHRKSRKGSGRGPAVAGGSASRPVAGGSGYELTEGGYGS